MGSGGLERVGGGRGCVGRFVKNGPVSLLSDSLWADKNRVEHFSYDFTRRKNI